MFGPTRTRAAAQCAARRPLGRPLKNKLGRPRPKFDTKPPPRSSACSCRDAANRPGPRRSRDSERRGPVAQLASMSEESAESRLERAGRWGFVTKLPQAEPRFVPPRATSPARCFCECGSSAHTELSARAKRVERAIRPHTRARLQRAGDVARGGGPAAPLPEARLSSPPTLGALRPSAPHRYCTRFAAKRL